VAIAREWRTSAELASLSRSAEVFVWRAVVPGFEVWLERPGRLLFSSSFPLLAVV